MQYRKRLLCLCLALMLAAAELAGLSLSASAACSVGNTIEYGTYPQSKVTDETTLAALNAALQSGDWQSFGYYRGFNRMDGTMYASDFMQYADVVLNGQKYRAVRFVSFRPYATWKQSKNPELTPCQQDNDYWPGNVYWFCYEPIRWRVLDPDEGLVISETAIDAQPFHNYYLQDADITVHGNDTFYGDAGQTFYPSDYARADIRLWLDADFCNTAFSPAGYANIRVSTLNNDCYATLCGEADAHDLDAAATQDKVFLLSCDEAMNNAYGFAPTEEESKTRSVYAMTDYACCQGLHVIRKKGYKDRSPWLLRTPGRGTACCTSVDADGRILSAAQTDYTYYGIRPAMRLEELKDDTDGSGVPCRAVFVADGRIVHTAVYPLGAHSIRVPDVPEKEGYTGAWDSYTLNGDITISAVYTPVTYTITWNTDGNSVQTQVRFGETIEPPAVPVREGFVFSGWTLEIPVTMPAHDLTLTAQYEEAAVTALRIVRPPEKTVYVYRRDKDVDLTGIELEADYSDGTTKAVDPAACTVSGYSAKPRGGKTVTLEFEGKTAQFSVTVRYAWWQWLILIFLFGCFWF